MERFRTTSGPVAEKRPVLLSAHGNVRVDEWAWLSQIGDPAVHSLIWSETAFIDGALGPRCGLHEELYEELVRDAETVDESVPARKNGYWYYWRYAPGANYATHYRRAVLEAGERCASIEEMLLDENVEAGDGAFFTLGGLDASPSGRLLAYSVDRLGNERYGVRIRDLDAGRDLPDEISGAFHGMAWSADESILFYVTADDTLRPNRVWRHTIGTNDEPDTLAYQEHDSRFAITVANTVTDAYVLITCESITTSEVLLIPSDEPASTPRALQRRVPGIKYSCGHHTSSSGSRFFLLTNAGGADGSVVETDSDGAVIGKIYSSSSSTALSAIEVFRDHVVVYERKEAGVGMAVVDIRTGAAKAIPRASRLSHCAALGNFEFDVGHVRYEYSSPTTPPQVWEYHFATGLCIPRKLDEWPADYHADEFVADQSWAIAHDGTRIPVTTLSHRDFLDKPQPAVLYGYGAVGDSVDLTFSSARLPLLRRGVLHAFAHVRGGGDLGARWHHQAVGRHKIVSFTDFLACADHLIAMGYARHDALAARGNSAGGMLVAGALNMRPDLFAAAVVGNPAVDVLTTMSDPTLPLTTQELEELGDPNDPLDYRSILGYSPYDNVVRANYPPIYVTASLQDQRVGFWEPLKWAQRIRDRSTGRAPVLVRVHEVGSHHGASGRFAAWDEEAEIAAFLLRALGVDQSHALP
jgi:oligopeptidase B